MTMGSKLLGLTPASGSGSCSGSCSCPRRPLKGTPPLLKVVCRMQPSFCASSLVVGRSSLNHHHRNSLSHPSRHHLLLLRSPPSSSSSTPTLSSSNTPSLPRASLSPDAASTDASPTTQQHPTADHSLLVSTQNSTLVMESAHPDAVRRRQEAEERRKQRKVDAKIAVKLASENKWWKVGTDALGNVHDIKDANTFVKQMLNGVSNKGLVVCIFYAPWCAGCRSLHPKLTQIAARNPDVTFLRVSGDGEDECGKRILSALGVYKLPYFQFYTASDGLVEEMTASLMPTKLEKLRRTLELTKIQASSTLKSFAWPDDGTPPALKKVVSQVVNR
mmetsp:Transcript_6614/g.17240  ORF Transcript_6614/g.17240 Transcript_6614/m.17240 type:complete len:332 (+) Transcript_6614:300-1295(+)